MRLSISLDKQMKRKIRSDEDNNNIDLTPMLDVIFIMLIFFIVTTSFVKESGIEVDRPKAATSEQKPKATIIVSIDANGLVWLDKRQIDINSVSANIERLKATNTQNSVIIAADINSNTGDVVTVMDQIRSAGIKNISISTKEK